MVPTQKAAPVKDASSKRDKSLKHAKTMDTVLVGKKRKHQEITKPEKAEKVKGDKTEKKLKRSKTPPVIEPRQTRSAVVAPADSKKRSKR